MKTLIESDANATRSKLNESAFENEEEPVYQFSKLRHELDDCLDGDDKKNLTTSMSLVCLLYLGKIMLYYFCLSFFFSKRARLRICPRKRQLQGLQDQDLV